MKRLLILALMASAVLLSDFGVPVDGTANYHAAAELHRSMARYRRFVDDEDTAAFMRNLLQVDEKEKSNQQQQVQSEKQNGDEDKEPAGDENSINRHTEVDVQDQSQDQQRQDVKEKEAPVEEELYESQEIEKSVANPHEEEEVDESDHPTAESHSTELHTENGNENQPDKDPAEKQEPAGDTSTESKTDENSDNLPRDEKESGLNDNQEEVVADLKEPVLELATEEHQNEKQEPDHQQQQEGETQEQEQEEGDEGNKSESSEPEPFVFPEPHLLGPKIDDWDQQRAQWLNENPDMKSTDSKPKVLIVTGSQPGPCRSSEGDYFHVKSLKVKIDYARIHNYEIYYNFAWLDPQFGSYWVKLPILRKLMLTHPEIEWFFWIDSDAVFTDMLFEAPFHTYEGKNMVMWGYHEGFFVNKSWVAFNAGVFLIRNCQWSLDLFDKWSPMGPDGPVRDEYGKILSAFLANRIEDYPADDQSALAYLILTDEAVKSGVRLVDLTEYMVSAWWVEVVDSYETSMEMYHPGLGDKRWPWITHFTGCGPCGGDESGEDYQKCMKNIHRALNFADNQVLAYMDFQHESLSSETVLRIRNESDQPLERLGVNPWAQRIAQLAAATA